MRVLVVDQDSARAALVVEGLAGSGVSEIRRASGCEEAELRAYGPDVVVISADCPDRDSLEGRSSVSVFAAEPDLAREAIWAGVAVYATDGYAISRLQGLLRAATLRFELMGRLRLELERAEPAAAA